jgi:hypothetical protein
MADDDVTNVCDFLDALGQTIASSDPAKRELLAQAIEAYSNDLLMTSIGQSARKRGCSWGISRWKSIRLVGQRPSRNRVLPFVLLTENRETKSDADSPPLAAAQRLED